MSRGSYRWHIQEVPDITKGLPGTSPVLPSLFSAVQSDPPSLSQAPLRVGEEVSESAVEAQGKGEELCFRQPPCVIVIQVGEDPGPHAEVP